MMQLILNPEQARLDAIERYQFAELPHDSGLDDLARLAAEICDTPVAGISIVEKDVISIIGSSGLDISHVPRGALPCERTVLGTEIVELSGARRVVLPQAGGLNLRHGSGAFYAGAPVLSTGGSAVGSLFVIDKEERALSARQRTSLLSLSQMVTTRLELTTRSRETERASQARFQTKAALTAERNFIAAVLDTVGALVVVFDAGGRIVRFNRACEILFGYPAAEVLGRYAWERLVPQDEVCPYMDRFERILGGEFPTNFESPWQAANGARRLVSWTATAMLDAQQHVSFVIATGVDITQQRLAAHAIRESESRFRQIVEGSLGLVSAHDMEGRILSINEQGARDLGYEVQELSGANLKDLVHDSGPQDFDAYLDELARQGEAEGLMHLRHRSGDRRVLAYRNRLVEAATASPYVLAFAVDITNQVRAEEELRALHRQSNSVLESIGDGIIGVDLDGRITVLNPAAAQMLGYRADELIGRTMHEAIHHTRPDGEPHLPENSSILESLRQMKRLRSANEVFWRKDGTFFPVEYVACPQFETVADPGPETGKSGAALGVVVAFADISDRNALDRMKDEFISTVSHELKTPITGLRAALGLLAGGALDSRPEKRQQMMNIAIGNTDRLVSLVNDILELENLRSGKAEFHFNSCSVEEVFRRAIMLLQTQAARANVHFHVCANGVTAWADPDRMLQVITNLLSNAIKFSPPAGDRPTEVRLTATYLSRQQALIEVQDHGRGIPPDKLGEIFERFKQVDASDSRELGGTGLGLAICRSIVGQHGGHIWATSELGEGSILHFTLPSQPQRRAR